MKDMAKLDEKLKEVDSAVLDQYEKNLLQLAELRVLESTRDSEEEEPEEGEEDKLAKKDDGMGKVLL
jgi:hypothetical protein